MPSHESPDQSPSFDFSADDVLQTLRPKFIGEGGRLEFIGSATSDFQAEPILYGPDGEMLPPLSDWELEVRKNIEGKKSGIVGSLDPETLPRFLQRKEEYIDRSKEMGENMFRFSLDFVRLCPREGEFNTAHMGQYVKALAHIRSRGQEPMLTIHHFAMPRFLIETDKNDSIIKGGWENPEVSKHFRFYIENVMKFLGDEDKVREILAAEGFSKETQDQFLSEGLVKYFISINEPMTTLLNGYLVGVFPPYRKGGLYIKKVLERMSEAHEIAYDSIKSLAKVPDYREPQIGASYNWNHFDGMFAEAVRKIANEYTTSKMEKDGAHSDFLGLQYYFRQTAPLIGRKHEGRDYGDHSTFGDMYPPGILEEIRKMNAAYPNKEIFITEMGFSEKGDKRKPYWILETMRYIIEAKKEGLPVKGVLLWSLVNNLEWDLGTEAQFGLFDERELSDSMAKDPERMRSFEAWKAMTNAIVNPSTESLNELQACYVRARKQYESSKN